MVRCPKCGEKMQRKGTHAGMRYHCLNKNCPVIGMMAKPKFDKKGQLMYTSGYLIFDSTYRGVDSS